MAVSLLVIFGLIVVGPGAYPRSCGRRRAEVSIRTRSLRSRRTFRWRSGRIGSCLRDSAFSIARFYHCCRHSGERRNPTTLK